MGSWTASHDRLNKLLFWVILLERFGNGCGAISMYLGSGVVLDLLLSDLKFAEAYYTCVLCLIEFIRSQNKLSKADHELFFTSTKGVQFKRLHIKMGFPFYLSAAFILLSIYGIIEIFLHIYGFHFDVMNWFLIRALVIGVLSVMQFLKLLEAMKDNTAAQLTPLICLLAYGGSLVLFHNPLENVAYLIAILYVAWAMLFLVQNKYAWPWLCQSLGRLLPAHTLLLWPHTFSIKLWLAAFPLLRKVDALPLWVQQAAQFIFRPSQLLCVSILIFLLGIQERFLGVGGSVIIIGGILIGNIQIPFALARIALAIMQSQSLQHHTPDKFLVAALAAFNLAVFCQGSLYALAGLLEALGSPIFQLDLAKKLDINHKQGHESIDLYYQYAYMKGKENGLIEEKEIDIRTYAICLLSDPKPAKDMTLCSLRILKSIMEIEGPKGEIISELNVHTLALHNLVRMMSLQASHSQYKELKFLSTKIIVMAASEVQFIGITGALPSISSLLFEEGQKNSDPQPVNINLDKSNGATFLDFIRDMIDPPQGEGRAPAEEDALPLLAMEILEKICQRFLSLDMIHEISREDVIGKVMEFSMSTKELFAVSALKLLSNLSSMESARFNISKSPLLISNISRLLEGPTQVKSLTVRILTNVGLHERVRQEAGTCRPLLRSLITSFCEGDKGAGKALLLISLQNFSCISAIWDINGHSLLLKLMEDLQVQDSSCVQLAAALAENLLECVPVNCDKIIEPLNAVLSPVLQKIMASSIQEVHFLIGFISKVCEVTPQSFVALPCEEAVVTKLVCGLHTYPTNEYPRIRRVSVQMVISLVKAQSHYAILFEKHRVLRSLEVLEDTNSNVENYRLSLHEGLLLDKHSFSELLEEAKELIKAHSDPGSQGVWTGGEIRSDEE